MIQDQEGKTPLFFLASLCTTLVNNPTSAHEEILGEFKPQQQQQQQFNESDESSPKFRARSSSISSWGSASISNNSPGVCSICSASFSSEQDLLDHAIEHVHGSEQTRKIKQCPICAKVFSNNTQLVTHLRVHTKERPYTCEHCGKSFTQKSTLNRHARVHTGERPFRCSQCFKSFAQKSTLLAHLTTHGFGASRMLDEDMDCDTMEYEDRGLYQQQSRIYNNAYLNNNNVQIQQQQVKLSSSPVSYNNNNSLPPQQLLIFSSSDNSIHSVNSHYEGKF
jgi:uncharacterized Zn-finger protein